MQDKDLVCRYLDGDVDALGELVERYRRPLFGYILNMTGSATDADEVFQETWLRVIRKIRGYRHRNFMGWLVRISRNLVIDRARRRKPQVSLDAELGEGRSLGETLPGATPGPDAQTEDAELGRRIMSAVASLPVEQKEVFLMRVKTGLPFRQVAAIQGVSINTALARMQYALDKLRPILRNDYEDLGRGSAPSSLAFMCKGDQ